MDILSSDPGPTIGPAGLCLSSASRGLFIAFFFGIKQASNLMALLFLLGGWQGHRLCVGSLCARTCTANL